MTRFVLVTMLLATLPGCAKTTALGAIEACTVWPYTSWSSKDTDATITGNKLNNARRASFCEGKS